MVTHCLHSYIVVSRQTIRRHEHRTPINISHHKHAVTTRTVQ